MAQLVKRPTRLDIDKDRLPILEGMVEDSSNRSTLALQAQVRRYYLAV